MISATDNQEGFKLQEIFIHFDIKETFNRPAFNAGQIFQPFDANGRSLYSKLVKSDGEKKNPIPVVKLFGMIQMVIFNQPSIKAMALTMAIPIKVLSLERLYSMDTNNVT